MFNFSFCQLTVNKTVRVLFVALCCIVLNACVNKQIAQTTPELESDKLIPISTEIIKGELDNGLQYIVRENQKPEQFAELRLIVKAGAMQEDEAQLGFAHFVEHMAFNGTEDFKKREIIEFVESIGMQFGAHLNAYTSFDETVYKLRIPLNQEGALETGIHILENWAHKISFDANTIDEERGVVLEEWRSRKGASERIREQTMPLLLAGSDYPNRLPIGSPEIIKNGSYTDLQRYYTTWYRPDLMSVVAVGDFDGNHVEQLIQRYFSKIIPAQSVYHKKKQQLSALSQPAIKIVSDDELTSGSLAIIWRQPAFNRKTIDDIRKATIHNLLVRTINTRFNESIWKPDNSYLNAGIGYSRAFTLGHQFSLGVTPKPGQLATSFDDTLQILYQAMQHGITQIELDRQKKIVVEGWLDSLSKKDTFSHNTYVGSYTNHFLHNSPIADIEFEAQAVKDAIDSISTLDLTEQLKAWLAEDNAVIIASLPSAELTNAPSEALLLNIYQKAKQNTSQAYIAAPDTLQLMDNIPPAGSIVQRDYIEKWDTHVWELSNGIKVHLKVTDFKDNQIRFWAYSPGGYAKVSDAQYLKSFGMINSIANMGLGDLDTEAFNQYSRDKRFRFSTQIRTYSEQAYGNTTQEELVAFMQSLHLNFVAPRKDAEIFEWLKGLYKPQIQKRFNNPQALFYSKIRQATNAGNPRSIEFDEQVLEQQDLDTIYQIRKQGFENAADFHYVFVGDMDLAQMELLLNTYMATLPTTDARETAMLLPDFDSEGEHVITLKKGSEQKATVIMNMWGDAQWTPQSHLVFGALKAALQNRLLIRLREELSGVYSVNVGGSFSQWPYQENNVQVSFTCDPNRIDELRLEVEAIFAEFVAGDIDEQSLANYQTRLITQRQKQLKENGFWIERIMNPMLPYTNISLADYEPLVNSLTKQMLVDAAGEYLMREDKYIATLLPEDATPVTQESAELHK